MASVALLELFFPLHFPLAADTASSSDTSWSDDANELSHDVESMCKIYPFPAFSVFQSFQFKISPFCLVSRLTPPLPVSGQIPDILFFRQPLFRFTFPKGGGHAVLG